MDRRTFLSLGAAGAFGLTRGARLLGAQLPPLSQDDDRLMLCGSPEMLAEMVKFFNDNGYAEASFSQNSAGWNRSRLGLKPRKASSKPGHFWSTLLEGEHLSSDVAVIDGRPCWWRRKSCIPTTCSIAISGNIYASCASGFGWCW